MFFNVVCISVFCNHFTNKAQVILNLLAKVFSRFEAIQLNNLLSSSNAHLSSVKDFSYSEYLLTAADYSINSF